MMGTSTADSAMKMIRIVSTGLWKLNPGGPARGHLGAPTQEAGDARVDSEFHQQCAPQKSGDTLPNGQRLHGDSSQRSLPYHLSGLRFGECPLGKFRRRH